MTIVPPPCSIICATAARVARSAAKKFSWKERSKSSSLTSRNPFRSQLDAADVVHEHVDAAVPLDRLLDEPLRAAWLDEVYRDGGHAVDPFERVDSERTADDLHSLGDEGVDDGQADALAGAGDDGDLAVELEIHRLDR